MTNKKRPDLLEAAEVILKGGMPGMGYLEEAVTAERERRGAVSRAVAIIKQMDCDCAGEGVADQGGCFPHAALREIGVVE